MPDKPIDFSTPGPIVSATPYVAQTATPQASVVTKGGPVTMSFNGSATVGARVSASTQGGSQTGSTNAAGFSTTLARRTPNTALRMTIPAGFVGAQASFGELQAGFDAAHFSLSYQTQSFSALGTLPLGATVRGPGLTFPTRYGDALIFGGTAFADNQRGFNTRAARLRVLLPRGFAGLSIYDAHAQDGAGRISGISAGYATVPARLDGTLELALERTKNLQSARDGTSLSYALRGDYGSATTYATAVIRNLPDGFAPLATLATSSDSLKSLNLRASPGATSINLETSIERFGDSGGATVDNRSSISISGQPRAHLSTSLFLNNERVSVAGQTQWNGNVNVAAAWGLPLLTLQSTFQVGRATQSEGSPSSSSSFSIGATRFALGSSLDFSYLASRNDVAGFRDHTSTLRLGLARLRARSVTGLATTITHTQAGGVDQTVYGEVAEIARHISPALTITVDGIFQIVRDHRNPLGSGTNRQLNVSLNTPFTFGNGALTGRIDPRLPATITGTVVNDADTFSAANGVLPSGIGGINIILDGRQIQRTDAQGRFEFRSVRPGRHEIAIDPASLPRGLTADQPYTSLTVQGGQVAQYTFGLGAFGAIEGRITGRDRNGKVFPIPDVTLRIDDTRDVQTTASGSFGIGRLTPGAHVIEIRGASFPASIGLVGETRRSVTVHPGERVTIDFRGEPLGSIAGRVIADATSGQPAGTGLGNVYVVANPGDRAAITNADGSYFIDNLPPGSYTVVVDEETLIGDLGVLAGPNAPIAVAGSEAIDGVVFTIGHKDRPIDFTFTKSDVVGALALGRALLPPGGATSLTVSGLGEKRAPNVSAFHKDVAVLFDRKRGVWHGVVRVPRNAPSGDASVVATSGDSSAKITLHVDSRLPIAIFTLTPERAVRGQYVHVRARFFTEIQAGDKIIWSDGTSTVLSSIKGSVTEFDVRLGAVPYHGILTTANGPVQVTIGR